MNTRVIHGKVSVLQQRKSNSIWEQVLKYRYLYLMLLPAIVFYIIFYYFPIYGITLAFQDFSYKEGILGSPFVGLANFKGVFNDPDFWRVTANTVVISFWKLVIGFPAPIITALLLNEISRERTKRFFQTVFTFPHFVSWVVVSAMMFNLLSDSGVVNQLFVVLGLEKMNFLTNASTFRPMLYITDVWKDAGWNTIIYLAAVAGINSELYEASDIDGANRWQRLIHITWPGIRSTAAILLILAAGNVMNAGFDQILNLYNGAVMDKADIIDTYVFRRSILLGSDWGSSTAIGLFKSVINFVLLFGVNGLIRVIGEEGIF